MKRLIFVAFILLFMAQYSYAEEKDSNITRISITLEEQREIIPDILNMTLSFNATAQKEAEVLNILGSIDKNIRALGVKYSGGSYSVYKNCNWENNKYKCSGYEGDIEYSFQLKEPTEQNKIYEAVDSFKEKYGEKVNYSVTRPQWLVSEKKAKSEEDNLKLEIIDTAKQFGNKAGEKLGKKCSISSINYDVRRPYFFEPGIYKAVTMMNKSMIEAPEPKKEDKTLNVKASLDFICK